MLYFRSDSASSLKLCQIIREGINPYLTECSLEEVADPRCYWVLSQAVLPWSPSSHRWKPAKVIFLCDFLSHRHLLDRDVDFPLPYSQSLGPLYLLIYQAVFPNPSNRSPSRVSPSMVGLDERPDPSSFLGCSAVQGEGWIYRAPD